MKTLNILGYIYDLKKDRAISEMDGNVGYWNPNNLELSVANDLPVQARISTTLHEIIEAINYHLELELNHKQIMGLETALHQTLESAGVNLDSIYSDAVTYIPFTGSN